MIWYAACTAPQLLYATCLFVLSAASNDGSTSLIYCCHFLCSFKYVVWGCVGGKEKNSALKSCIPIPQFFGFALKSQTVLYGHGDNCGGLWLISLLLAVIFCKGERSWGRKHPGMPPSAQSQSVQSRAFEQKPNLILLTVAPGHLRVGQGVSRRRWVTGNAGLGMLPGKALRIPMGKC